MILRLFKDLIISKALYQHFAVPAPQLGPPLNFGHTLQLGGFFFNPSNSFTEALSSSIEIIFFVEAEVE